MDKIKAINYLETSFLRDILQENEITDITYNGVDIYYVTNTEGRKKSDITIENQVVRDFLRQIANICEKQFSYASPSLDVSFGKYRVNATHQCIGRIYDEGAVTFAIRIASEVPRITNKSNFLTPELQELVKLILSKRMSIVLGGITGSGKTEFQKYLIRSMKKNERVVVIDNIMELDTTRSENLDLTCWQVDENNPNSSAPKLIRNALRNNPDWLIVAESRGEEMIHVLESAMTGLPIITTIHAFDAHSMPYRMARMVLSGNSNLNYKETLKDIYYHFHFYFFLKKEETENEVKRYIQEIIYIDNEGRPLTLYQRYNNKHVYGSFVGQIIKDLDGYQNNKTLSKTFMKGEI